MFSLSDVDESSSLVASASGAGDDLAITFAKAEFIMPKVLFVAELRIAFAVAVSFSSGFCSSSLFSSAGSSCSFSSFSTSSSVSGVISASGTSVEFDVSDFGDEFSGLITGIAPATRAGVVVSFVFSFSSDSSALLVSSNGIITGTT